MIVATHGRSLWVLDDASVVAQLSDAAGKQTALLPVKPALRFARRSTRMFFGDKVFTGQNPEYGAKLTYFLASESKAAQIDILDDTKQPIVTIAASAKQGLNRADWDLRYAAPKSSRRNARGPQVLPGHYLARLTVGATIVEQPITVELDPEIKATATDLKAQLDMSKKLLDLQSDVSTLLRKLRDSEPASPQIAELSAQLARPATANRSESPAGLRDNLEALFNMIDGVDAAPTQAQTRYFEQLRAPIHRPKCPIQRAKWKNRRIAEFDNDMLSEARFAL